MELLTAEEQFNSFKRFEVPYSEIAQTEPYNAPMIDELNDIQATQNELAVKLGADHHTTPEPKKPIFTKIGDLLNNRVCISWLIRDYLPLNSTCMLYGESGAGKSFLMLDMALSIASGKQWAGQKTKQGAVFYVAGEAHEGITTRAYAWSINHDVNLNDVAFFVSSKAVLLPDKNNLIELMSELEDWIKSTGQNPLLIVFDTMARCLVGDENSTKDAGAYIQAMDIIKQRFKCCVVNVHHTGKDAGKGGRGSSAFKGACDMELFLSVQGDVKRLENSKPKEITKPNDKFFTLESIATDWLDDDGEVIYSAVMIETTDYTPTNSKTKAKLKPNEEKVLSCLSKALNDKGIEPTQAIKDLFTDSVHNIPLKVVNIDYWQPLAYECITTNSKSDATDKAKQHALYMAFNRIYPKLEQQGFIGLHGGYAWIAKR